MKKMVIMGLLFLVGSVVYASSNRTVVVSNVSLKNYYSKMKTCTPVKMSGMEVVGKVGGKCQFKEGPVTCNVPMSVAQRYAAESLKTMSGVSTNKYVDEVINNPQYCKF